ncbi:hypothetical protein DICPUDRAFT_152490 [Dictyostelium purpureum]|uniref:Cytokinin riboside 5'-monophosphate phosphoribohydrolase n=1 Tax=Dictyostelium purpureum TaxID=5786 RepID=F0ZLH8_DICPU|nr:uncharacterized protein DICPUDRAFT_152490 [Dictyostelium purpureum]EGC35190.1 hypothetical protein DICPUDRAFT_152490 [Dictyostelium purpureum]|eukprot:XP_003288278.1 hypothetical protein DICPUDRAFT_152490 [Dictyostelium purpureum]
MIPGTKKIKNICVFCGSRKGNDEKYVEVTKQLASEMGKRGYGLVYGGGNIGIMGAVSHGVQEAGGNVKGIIPRSLSPKEISGTTVGEVTYVDSMHTRKEIMYNSSDAFIALPGGIGTFEELFECMTWVQLGIHSKPVGILNVNGYYDHLVSLLKNSVDSGFVDGRFISSLIVETDPIELLNKLESNSLYKSEITWLTSSQA